MKVSRSWRLVLTLSLVSSIVIMVVNAAISTTRVITPIFSPGAQIQNVPQQAIITPTFNATLGLWIANVTGWKILNVHVISGGSAVILFSNSINGNFVMGVGCIGSVTLNSGTNACIQNNGNSIIVPTQGQFIGITNNINSVSSAVYSIFATNG